MALELDGLSLTPELADVMQRLAKVAAQLQHRIARNGIDGDLSAARGVNAGGDGQKALDVIADEAYAAELRGSAVAFFASEEEDDFATFGPVGPNSLALAMDPLDGSSNIDVNASIGTIFAIFPAAETAEKSFLRKGSDILAGGVVVFGPQCTMIVTFGDGVYQFTLDPDSRDFKALGKMKPLPEAMKEFAVNASNARHWDEAIAAYIADLQAGETGPRGRNFNMRWVAALAADAERILKRGGVFLYPGDRRKGYEKGRLRYLYECAPIAFMIEQSGGAATDGVTRILDLTPEALHVHTPFVFGAAHEVARIAAYHKDAKAAAAASDDAFKGAKA